LMCVAGGDIRPNPQHTTESAGNFLYYTYIGAEQLGLAGGASSIGTLATAGAT